MLAYVLASDSRVKEKSETIEMMVSSLRVHNLVRACCFGRKLLLGGRIYYPAGRKWMPFAYRATPDGTVSTQRSPPTFQAPHQYRDSEISVTSDI